jgi:hypothetical protein
MNKEDFIKLLQNKKYIEFQNKFVGLKKSTITGEIEFQNHILKRRQQIPLKELPMIVKWYLNSSELEYFAFEKSFKSQDMIQFFVVPPIMSGLLHYLF